MGSKLDTGDSFPVMQLKMVDGTELSLPEKSGANYQIIIFYRGAF